jgi:hypothetical protein
MDFLNVQIDVLTILRIIGTAVIVGAFSVFTYLQINDAYWLSDVQTGILVRIAIESHPKIPDIAAVLEYQGPYEEDTLWVGDLGELDEIAKGPLEKTSRRMDYWLLLFFLAPPSAAILAVGQWLDKRKARVDRVFTTAFRRIVLAGASVFGVSSLGYVLAAVALGDAHPWFAMLLGSIGAIGLLGSFALAAGTIDGQVKWRNYWREVLAEIAWTALQTKDTGLFQKAMIAKSEVDAAPSAPLPAAFGFYVATFSAVQIGLTALAGWVTWL